MVDKIATIHKRGKSVSVILKGYDAYRMGSNLIKFQLGERMRRKEDGSYEVLLGKEKSEREVAYDTLADQGYVVKGKGY